MFRTGTRIRQAALLALLLTSSCASYYRLKVGGERLAQVHSLFLIATNGNPYDGGDPSELISPEKTSTYLLFAQFDPKQEGANLCWHQEVLNVQNSLLKLELSKDKKALTLSANKELREAYPELTILAVAYGDQWYAQAIDAGVIRLEKGMTLNVDASKFVITEKK